MAATVQSAPTRQTNHEGVGMFAPLIVLRLEGFAAFVAGLVGFYLLSGSWLLVITVMFLPDLAMIGYAFGSRIGARAYNLAHTYVAPAVLAAASLFADGPLLAIACVWVAHIGMDRALGYGLKLETSFHDTHLGRIGRPRA